MEVRLQGAIEEASDRIRKNIALLFNQAVNAPRMPVQVEDLVRAKFEAYPPWSAIVEADTTGRWHRKVAIHVEFIEGEAHEASPAW